MGDKKTLILERQKRGKVSKKIIDNAKKLGESLKNLNRIRAF
jgi:hypothetical protein